MSEADRSARFRYRLSGRREREQDVFFEDSLDPALWGPGDEKEWDTCWHTGMPERAAFRVAGIRGVVNDLEVRLPDRFERSDTDISKAAVRAVNWHTPLPAADIDVAVDNGWVTLAGTVNGNYHRQRAAPAVRVRIHITSEGAGSADDVRNILAAGQSFYLLQSSNDTLKTELPRARFNVPGRTAVTQYESSPAGPRLLVRGLVRNQPEPESLDPPASAEPSSSGRQPARGPA